MGAHILVVEDDCTLSTVLRLYLDREGYRVSLAHDGASGLAEAKREPPDLVVLDLMLPRMDGWEVCRHLRSAGAVPIVLLTALDQEHQKVRGFDLGADDYVTKPFSMKELLARVRALLRRGRQPEAPATEPLHFPDLRIDPVARHVDCAGCRAGN